MRKIIISAVLAVLLMPFSILAASSESENAAPTVIPAIREWRGSSGKYELKPGAKIAISTPTPGLEKRAALIKEYFEDMLSYKIEVKEGAPKAGDIHFVLDKTKTDLGGEGYLLEVGDIITVTAADEQGIFYGCITVLQSLYADGFVPKGSARDYPAYEIRSGMVDVARAYLPLEYVEEITKYMAWFKLNEIHLHINDQGANNYTAFRLESDVPGLTSKDGFYTKSAYRDYQKRMQDYGISVITEIDTPAHSGCFKGVVPEEYMLDASHINITVPEAVKFVEDLFDEYITGDDPVFVNKKVHIGTDEYPGGYNEQMREYTNRLIGHINSRGYTSRFWGSFGNDGFNGTTPVSGEAEANFWAVSLSDYKTLFDMGYDIINTCGPALYVVPGGNYGFPDYYDLSAMYKNWFVNYMGTDKSTAVDADDPQLKGASFALWNDRHTEYGGFSAFDIFDRLKGMICFTSEKTWCGGQTADIETADFIKRFDILSQKAGGTNPGRTQNLPIKEGFNPDIKSVGFPYAASFDITVNEFTENCLLFDGSDGSVVLNKNGTVSLLREGYEFLYNCKIQTGKSTSLKFVADNKKTVLIMDETYFYDPVNKRNTALNESSTFVFPLEHIAVNLQGEITGLLIDKNNINLGDFRLNANHALKKEVTVSGLEVTDGRFNEKLAVDGDLGTRLSFANDTDEQWMVVDLGSEKDVNTVVISFFESVGEYKILVSTDGVDFAEVYREQNGSEREKKTVTARFDMVGARYVKYVQIKRFLAEEWQKSYSGGISEFEVYGYDMSVYDDIIAWADALIDSGTLENEQLRNIKAAKKDLRLYMAREEVYAPHINALKDILAEAIGSHGNGSVSSEPLSGSGEEPAGNNFSPWLLLLLIPLSGAAALLVKKRTGSSKTR